MKLLSVNVGTPRRIAWNDRLVTTAIYKVRVDGPRFVGRINVEGDDQADRVAHGGEHRAVFVYQSGLFGHVPRPPHAPAGPPGSGPLVLFSRSNLTVRWDPSFGSLLDLAEACDVPAGFGCRTGVCHACQSGLVSGEVSYQVEPLEPPPAGEVLLCCSQPRTDTAIDL